MSDSGIALAVDNSLGFLNLAIGGEGGKLIEERHSRADNRSSEILALRVGGLLTDHACNPQDLTHIMVTLGPGSFTGVRVGLAFCKGLSVGLGVPLVGIPTPDVLAAALAFMDDTYICPIIDAKKGEVFCALYSVSAHKTTLVDGYYAVKPDDLARRIPRPCVCVGSGVHLYQSVLAGLDGVTILGDGFQRITGEGLLRCGAERLAEGPISLLRPIYGRRSEAEIKFGVEIT